MSSFKTIMPTDSLHVFLKIAEYVAQVGFTSTLFTCSALIYLTVFKIERDFGSYKYLLVLFPSVGIFFATIDLILCPNGHSYNASYVFFTTRRPFGMSKNATIGFLSSYAGVFASTISMLSAQFLYRYWAIFSEENLRFFKGWRFCFCILYSIFFGALWTIGIYFFMEVDTYSMKYLQDEMMEKYSTNISETAGLILVAYNESGSVRWWNLGGIFDNVSIMQVQYAIIIYCAYFMYAGMEEKLKMLSLSTRNTHKQFFKTLLLQIVLPTVILFCPVTFIMLLPLLDIKISMPNGFMLCAFTLYPAMDAIIVMCIVQDYKKAVKKMVSQLLDKCQKMVNNGQSGASNSIQFQSTNVNAVAVRTDVSAV